MKHLISIAFFGALLFIGSVQGQNYSACSTPSPKKAPVFDHPVAENLLAWYENLAIQYVARRRKFNAFRGDLVHRLKTGRVLNIDVVEFPKALAFESLLALKFGWHFLTQPRLGHTGQRGV